MQILVVIVVQTVQLDSIKTKTRDKNAISAPMVIFLTLTIDSDVKHVQLAVILYLTIVKIVQKVGTAILAKFVPIAPLDGFKTDQVNLFVWHVDWGNIQTPSNQSIVSIAQKTHKTVIPVRHHVIRVVQDINQ